jgi:hypothetical protein
MHFQKYNEWWWQAQQIKATMCAIVVIPKAKTKPSSEESNKMMFMKALSWKYLMLVDGKMAMLEVTTFK